MKCYSVGGSAVKAEGEPRTGQGEFYTINGIASYFAEHPIFVQVGEPVRVYLVNMIGFDTEAVHTHYVFTGARPLCGNREG